MFVRVLKGLGRSFQKIGAFLGLIGLIGLVALIVAIPLWYFSSKFAVEYTFFVIVLAAAALLSGLIVRLVRLSREPDALWLYFYGKILPILKTAAVVVASAAVVYAIAVLISRGQTVLSILAAVLWVLLLGFLKYGRRGKR